MNFKFDDDDDSLDKIIVIFEYIEEKLGIDLERYFYEDKRRTIS